jgi:hypothetical protein
MPGAAPTDEGGGTYRGWLAGGVAILIILGVGFSLWFKYHPW